MKGMNISPAGSTLAPSPLERLSRSREPPETAVSKLSDGLKLPEAPPPNTEPVPSVSDERENVAQARQAKVDAETEALHLRRVNDFEVKRAAEEAEVARPPRAAPPDALATAVASRAISAYRNQSEQTAVRPEGG